MLLAMILPAAVVSTAVLFLVHDLIKKYEKDN